MSRRERGQRRGREDDRPVERLLRLLDRHPVTGATVRWAYVNLVSRRRR